MGRFAQPYTSPHFQAELAFVYNFSMKTSLMINLIKIVKKRTMDTSSIIPYICDTPVNLA
jgi:hypothetical protein